MSRTSGSSSTDIWAWLAFAELVVEIGLGVAIAFMAVLDVYYLSPTIELILQAVLFGLNLLFWLILLFSAPSSPAPSVKQRGNSVLRQYSIYFLLATAAHAVLLVGWIVHLVKFAGLTPLNFTTNLAAFHVRRALDLLGFLFASLLLLFSIYDMRHSHLRCQIAQRAATQR